LPLAIAAAKASRHTDELTLVPQGVVGTTAAGFGEEFALLGVV